MNDWPTGRRLRAGLDQNDGDDADERGENGEADPYGALRVR